MYYAYDYDQKIMNTLHEQRRAELARTYADGQADALTLRLVTAKTITTLGDILVRGGQALLGGASRQQEQELQAVRIHAGSSR